MPYSGCWQILAISQNISWQFRKVNHSVLTDAEIITSISTHIHNNCSLVQETRKEIDIMIEVNPGEIEKRVHKTRLG